MFGVEHHRMTQRREDSAVGQPEASRQPRSVAEWEVDAGGSGTSCVVAQWARADVRRMLVRVATTYR